MRMAVTIPEPQPQDVTGVSDLRKIFVNSWDEMFHLERRAGGDAREDRRPAIAGRCSIADDLADGGHFVVVDLSGLPIAAERLRQ